MEETKRLVHKCQELSCHTLSNDVIDRVKYLFLDYLGVAARGSINDSSRPVHALLSNLGSNSDGAVVIGTNIRADSPYAALANGTAAHASELDDVVNEASLHPGVTIMSAALAAAHISECSGKEFMASVVAGYEVTTRLAISLDPSAPYAQGFHPTGTCGTMGSAITAAKILRLDQSKMSHALGIAGSQAAGSMEFLSDGAYTKRLHAGWAAHSGIIAALLAREGFTGPGTIIEGKFGFLHSYATQSNSDKVLADWGNPYYVMKTSIKPHACCRYKQGPIDCTLKIMGENDLKADDIETVTLGVLAAGFPLIVQPEELKRNPNSVVDAQFSMPFGAAVAILYGKADLDEYTLENINNPVVKKMMRKISCVTDKDLDREFPRKWPAQATVLTKNGKIFTAGIDYPKGDPESPLTWNELIDKFKKLTSPVFTVEKINRIIDHVMSLEKENDLKAFSKLLSK